MCASLSRWSLARSCHICVRMASPCGPRSLTEKLWRDIRQGWVSPCAVGDRAERPGRSFLHQQCLIGLLLPLSPPRGATKAAIAAGQRDSNPRIVVQAGTLTTIRQDLTSFSSHPTHQAHSWSGVELQFSCPSAEHHTPPRSLEESCLGSEQ